MVPLDLSIGLRKNENVSFGCCVCLSLYRVWSLCDFNTESLSNVIVVVVVVVVCLFLGLAKKSQSFYCPRCGHVAGLLPELKKERPVGSSRFQKEIEQLRLAQIANEANNNDQNNNNNNGDDTKAGVESQEPPKKDEVEEQGTKEEECTEGELLVEPTPPVPEQVESSPTGTTANNVAPPREAQTPELREATEPAQTLVQPESTTTTGATAAQLLPRNTVDDALDGIAWITDPVLNLTIVLLAVICFLLFHKARLVFDELRDLNAEILRFQQSSQQA